MGQRLSRLRRQVRLAQRQLDRIAWLPEGTVFRLETKEDPNLNPKLNVVQRIAIALGCSLDWLVRGEGEPPSLDDISAAMTAAPARLEALQRETEAIRNSNGPRPLHVFSWNSETVVAASAEDALHVLADSMGYESVSKLQADYDEDEITQLADNHSLSVFWRDDGEDPDPRKEKPLVLTCAQWAAKVGRGLLGSTES